MPPATDDDPDEHVVIYVDKHVYKHVYKYVDKPVDKPMKKSMNNYLRTKPILTFS